MNKQDALNKIEAMKKQIKELETIVNTPDKALRIEIVSRNNSLLIKYGDDIVGVITPYGECKILKTYLQIEAYNQWRKDGMPVDSTPVRWRVKNYQITPDYYLDCKSIVIGSIYNFDSCVSIQGCQDDNIKRFEHNQRPIGF